jgi:hypothetical protein
MVARLRVSTSGTSAASEDYANGAPTVGRALLSGGAGNPPTWGAPAGVVAINRLLFVDAVNSPGAGSTGTLAAPFATIQAAIDQAVVNGWDTVQLQVAFSTYADAIAIPISLVQVSIVAWDALQPAILSGDIVATTDPLGLTTTLELVNCLVTATAIATANVALQPLNVKLVDTSNAATITASVLSLELLQSTQSGNVTGTTSLFVRWDGYSWAATMQVPPVFTPAAYSRTFYDAGHDTYSRSLTTAGLAIGSTAFVDMVVPAYVRADDLAQIQVLDPTVKDFICGVHGTAAGIVTAWITNLSRVSTNFNEAIKLLIHHEQMVVEPPP